MLSAVLEAEFCLMTLEVGLLTGGYLHCVIGRCMASRFDLMCCDCSSFVLCDSITDWVKQTPLQNYLLIFPQHPPTPADKLTERDNDRLYMCLPSIPGTVGWHGHSGSGQTARPVPLQKLLWWLHAETPCHCGFCYCQCGCF